MSVRDDDTFSKLSDDVVLKILYLLEDDPRNWARLSCVSKKLSSLISTVCFKSKCLSTLSTDLLLSFSSSSDWSSLYKIAVCCPGLLRSGVLLDNSDFGLLRQLGPDQIYQTPTLTPTEDSNTNTNTNTSSSSNNNTYLCDPEGQGQGQTWTLYDDLYYDTVYDNSEEISMDVAASTGVVVGETTTSHPDSVESKKRKVESPCRLLRPHLAASGVWKLSREQGNKLLGSRFREDCLYISDWPGCIHMEEKRNYMVFRGVFKNFKRSTVWRTINDQGKGKGNRSRSKVVDLNCAFCDSNQVWDLHSSFCLKRGFGFHDDGQPVVRAYVCINGHVSGAWTDFPLYS